MDTFFTHIDINTVIIALVAIVLGFQQLRTGSSAIYKNTLEAYKAQMEVMERSQKDQATTINTQSGQIGELKGRLTAKEAQIAEYKQMLENRDPQLQQILKQLVDFMQKVDERLAGVEGHVKKPITATTSTVLSKQ